MKATIMYRKNKALWILLSAVNFTDFAVRDTPITLILVREIF